MHIYNRIALFSSSLLLMAACKKSVPTGGDVTPPTDTTVTVVTPTDPETAKTIGFF
jgi:hypothetical protein